MTNTWELYGDFYALTMAQSYFLSGKKDMPVVFDYFFRRNPYQGGYVVFAGLQDALEAVAALHFGDDACEFLKEKGFQEDFLTYLRDLQIEVDIDAVREGEIVFPYLPTLQVKGRIIEALLIETLLLNFLNFSSLIATKAARIKWAAKGRRVIDFGMRRAQGSGSILGSRAAIIGGMDATSHAYSAMTYGLEVSGTQAHAWIQSFEDELQAFRQYAATYPDSCVLLVDTYNTLKSGVPNAITVAQELEAQGHRLMGIRLDSGDLAYLSQKARRQLDGAGLSYVKIVASNSLDEEIIQSLFQQEAEIDVFGVGTRLATGHPDGALGGVYKLAECDGRPVMKFSENISKTTLPGDKDICRISDEEGFYADGVFLTEEGIPDTIFHPYEPDKFSDIRAMEKQPLRQQVMEKGEVLHEAENPHDLARYVQQRMRQLPKEFKRFLNPHVYKVGISQQLMDLRTEVQQRVK